TIYDADYLGGGPESFRKKILGFLPAETAAATAAITMITSARHFHYIFNPVSFFYCTDAAGSTRAIVVEVNNTFGERHVYVPEKTEPDRDNPWIRGKSEKAFHVSPFNDMEGTYDFFFSPPGRELDIRIHLIKNREKTFEARLWGRGTALSPASHLRLLLRHPLRPHLTKPRIFRQAAALYFRRHLPYHEKPEPISPMTIRKKS
ncbi:MAG TPA: DUF1365 family protein, partial [Desulfosalsimonadaceae bacterium]|nr:DUF1365 family protein [Desulfosalsimonadaceae bacterium]